MKVSVIIPVYNVEDYIEKCLNSLLQQTLNDIELIIVNDGTKDLSIEKIQYLVDSNKNIKLINQKNSGLSAARNTGLEYAEGEYVAFIDSDDYVESTFLEELYIAAIEDNLDISMSGYKKLKVNKYEEKERNYKLYNTVMTGVEFLEKELKYKDYCMEVWDDLYRLDFLKENNLKFEENLLHEDELFTPLALLKADRVKLIKSNKYIYRQREDSIMSNKPNINHINSCYFIINKFLDIYTNTTSKTNRYIMMKLLAHLTNAYEDKIFNSDLSMSNQKSLLKKIRNSYVLNIIRKSEDLTIKRKINYFLLQINFEVYYFCNAFKRILKNNHHL